MNRISIGGYTRISKAAARKLYNAGKDIYLCAVKLNPASPYNPACCVNQSEFSHISTAAKENDYISVVPRRDFESVVNCFTFYNCYLTETGKYPAFYVREEA